jgi:osomolarity two-component system sensor histidine kinase SLN1
MLQMPNLDGLQSTRLIREMGYSAPIVALTAFSEESNIRDCYDSVCDRFLTKTCTYYCLPEYLGHEPLLEQTDPTASTEAGLEAICHHCRRI